MSIPQHPVTNQDKVIEVKHAANNSGMVTFKFNNNKDATSSDDPVDNTDESVPAGLITGDGYNLVVTYMPEGEMGEGKLEFQMPSGWSAADVRVSGDESSTLPELPVESGDIITSTFYEGFGDSALDLIDITLVDITTPNQYGRPEIHCQSQK